MITSKVDEILANYGLDFTIYKNTLVGLNENGEQYPTPYYGLFNSKTGECLNTVKENYTISQNKDIVRVALAGMEKFGDAIAVQKAGSLNGGRKVYIQLRIEGDGDGKVGDDTVERFVTLIDSNDGSTGLSVGIGDLTMSCMNQFFKFYKAGEAKFRHTATIEQKIETMPELIRPL